MLVWMGSVSQRPCAINMLCNHSRTRKAFQYQSFRSSWLCMDVTLLLMQAPPQGSCPQLQAGSQASDLRIKICIAPLGLHLSPHFLHLRWETGWIASFLSLCFHPTLGYKRTLQPL